MIFPTNSEPEQRQVIVQVSGELARLTLYRARHSGGGWSFTRVVEDQTPELLGEEWIEHESHASSWGLALALLNEYPWERFCPTKVHIEFRDALLGEARGRLLGDGQKRWLTRWIEICTAPSPDAPQ